MGTDDSADVSGRIENIILGRLTTIEAKLDTAIASMRTEMQAGLSDHARRIGALEVALATLQTILTRSDAFWPRALPWLMFAWNILMVAGGGLVWLVTHVGH